MIENLIISEQVMRFVLCQRHNSNPIIVIYRDIAKFGCWYSAKPIVFVPKAKVMDEKKLNQYFIMGDNSYGIQIWIEKALLPKLRDKPVLISMKKGYLKGLKLEIGPDILKKQ
jgi:hypothetical protein